MEHLRRVVRPLLGYRSPIYRVASELANLAIVIRSEGISTWRILCQLTNRHTIASEAFEPVSVKLSNLEHPIRLRPGTEDASTVVQTVIREEYGDFNPQIEPAIMIDAGAYIGDTSAYFLSRFRGLSVIALEPSIETYEAARDNLAIYGDRVTLLNQGLTAKPGRYRFAGKTTSASLTDGGEEVECTSVAEIINRFSLQRVDILKLDIEGAETEIFASEQIEWLDRVDNILIEIHGPEAERVVLDVLQSSDFEVERYRSIYNCRRVA